MKKKVVVGLSGGVDSSVAIHLLKEQGYDCIGVTMRTWQHKPESEEERSVTELLEADARRVADKFDIPHYIVDFQDKFNENVKSYFVNEYSQGRTPNPCTVCNRLVKWNALLSKADELGAGYVATGHYARVVRLDNGRYTLAKTPTAVKEQTYALFRLSQEQLKRTIMPVGEYTKDEIRDIARRLGLPVADKPDSQEICFIPDNDYAGFIKNYSGKEFPEGNFVDLNGKIIGRHKGIIHYTVGQRKGLNLSLGYPAFVAEIRPDTNEVVIGKNEDVFSDILYADNLNYMGMADIPPEGIRLTAKIRYAHTGAYCMAAKEKGRLVCRFYEPQRAVTPGQAVVLYEGDRVAFGGTIIGTR